MRAEQVGVLPKCLLPGRTPRFRQALLFPSYTRFFAHSFDYHLVPCPHFLGGMGWPLPPAFSREMLPPAERRSAFKEQPLRTAEPRIMLGGWESTQQLPKPSPAQPSPAPAAHELQATPHTPQQQSRGSAEAEPRPTPNFTRLRRPTLPSRCIFMKRLRLIGGAAPPPRPIGQRGRRSSSPTSLPRPWLTRAWNRSRSAARVLPPQPAEAQPRRRAHCSARSRHHGRARPVAPGLLLRAPAAAAASV